MKDFIIAVDDYNISAYDTKAKSVMRIPDDAERMQEIGRLVQRISEEWPCIIEVEKHFKRYRGRALPEDLSMVSQYRWEDYINNEPSVCSGGFPIGYDLADEYGNLSAWYGEETPPRAIDRIWEQLKYDPAKPNNNTDKLCLLLTALQTEYEVLKMSGIEPQQPEAFVMDIRLQSDRAKTMFKAFADKGYIEIVEGGHYKWLKTKRKALFGYFVECASDHLGLTKYDRRNNTLYCRKPFEDLFDIHETARNTNQTPRPKGREKIDNIFNSLK